MRRLGLFALGVAFIACSDVAGTNRDLEDFDPTVAQQPGGNTADTSKDPPRDTNPSPPDTGKPAPPDTATPPDTSTPPDTTTPPDTSTPPDTTTPPDDDRERAVIRGTVFGIDSTRPNTLIDPVRDALVTLLRFVPGDSSTTPPTPPRLDTLATDRTNPQGKFHFEHLRRGTYLLVASAPGWIGAQQFVAARFPEEHPPSVTMYLHKP
jgi:hypothetical protein